MLESLSRSTGTKVAQSLNDLVRDTGLSRAVLAEMLSVLINERLVRPVGHETYEIQHDRLAPEPARKLQNTWPRMVSRESGPGRLRRAFKISGVNKQRANEALRNVRLIRKLRREQEAILAQIDERS